MADVEGLYIVTGVVLVALVGWVLAVLVRAPTAVDMSKPPAARKPGDLTRPAAVEEQKTPVVDEPKATVVDEPEAAGKGEPKASVIESKAGVVMDARASSPDSSKSPPELSVTPPPTVTSTEPEEADPVPSAVPAVPSSRSQRVQTMLGLAAPSPAVALAVARSRLDSHTEIQDAPSASSATVILMPEEGAGAKGSEPLVLVAAVGHSEPLPGKLPERHAILGQHHLLAFADGGGKKAGEELASAIVVDALAEAFEKNDASVFADDPKLPERANRIRRAALAANRRLLHRAREAGYAGMGTSMLAAYFSPDHRELFIAHVGASRGYCIRGGQLTRLTTPHGARTLGVIERVDVEVVQEGVRSSDLYLFFSDALGRAISESELLAWVNEEPSLDALTRRLVEAAREKDDTQDLVAIVVRVDPAAEGPAKIRGREMTVLGLG
jgi:serine/threonine protein phosphatase PrpC